MSRIRSLCVLGVLSVVLAQAAPARAELYKDVARGLALLDYRFSGERNLLGDGITVNTSAVYSNRQFDFGLGELTLTGVVSASAGFTRRGIPGADFSLNTGGTPLNYTFRMNNLGEDLTATGRVLINVDSEINALGFYTQTFEVSNRGTFERDGLLGDDNGTLAFDIGPINKSGNLFLDLLSNVTQPFFAATGTENPFAKLSQQATKLTGIAKSVEELQARAAAGEYLTDAELSSLINNSILAAVLGGKPSGKLFDDVLLPHGLLQTDGELVVGSTRPVPEPAGLTTFVLALAAGFRRRRRAG